MKDISVLCPAKRKSSKSSAGILRGSCKNLGFAVSASRKTKLATSTSPCIWTALIREPEQTYPIRSKARQSSASAAAHSLGNRSKERAGKPHRQFWCRPRPRIHKSIGSPCRCFRSREGIMRHQSFPVAGAVKKISPARAWANLTSSSSSASLRRRIHRMPSTLSEQTHPH